MAYTFNASQHIIASSPAATAVPLTMACWFNPDNTTSNGVLMSMLDSGSNNWTGFYLSAEGGVVGDPLKASAVDNNNFAQAVSSSGFSSGVWQHACGVFTTNSDRTIYLNAGSSGNDTTAVTPTAAIMDNTVIGRAIRTISDNGFLGAIAEPAIWSAALTVAEIEALADGVSPSRIRPQSLVFYPPLIRELTELRKGVTLTLGGTPTVSAHPRVYGL